MKTKYKLPLNNKYNIIYNDFLSNYDKSFLTISQAVNNINSCGIHFWTVQLHVLH